MQSQKKIIKFTIKHFDLFGILYPDDLTYMTYQTNAFSRIIS